MSRYDAVVVGAGVNGLCAAIVMAQAGRSVLVREAAGEVGGAARSAELTLPGFVHDPFSAVHPLALGSPFLQTLPLREHGLEWIEPPAAVVHPFDDGTAAVLERSIDATGETLGPDAEAYRKLIDPFARNWSKLAPDILGPLGIPRHPLLLARFGLKGLQPLKRMVEKEFRGAHARALLAGIAGHCGLPLSFAATAAFGLVLTAVAHVVGWPIPRGGAGRIPAALASYLRSLGGAIETDAEVRSLDELPTSRAVFLDLTPRQILALAGERLPSGYRQALQRYRYGVGVFKLDWALAGPVPWRAEACRRTATVHLAGPYESVLDSERRPWNGENSEWPLVLFVQQSLFDHTRAPEGKHTGWAYCHVPNGSSEDMTERIEAQVERFAPGFRDLILARHVMGPAELERRDANLVGGDINGGAPLLGQLFFRPTLRRNPYRTPVAGLYICSASTPPSGGVHGMCGYHAARSALADGL